ncbi:hypothetical protein OUZ56_021581 [Daphnia magna]|uniref:Uncharacterized protein n=1 Tax=Daphnia magna TaxID=35525 RepID=A0ABR0ATW8_9CRUS|nr:hypothetical protein OUZ56_021581 [Daphnia magna]
MFENSKRLPLNITYCAYSRCERYFGLDKIFKYLILCGDLGNLVSVTYANSFDSLGVLLVGRLHDTQQYTTALNSTNNTTATQNHYTGLPFRPAIDGLLRPLTSGQSGKVHWPLHIQATQHPGLSDKVLKSHWFEHGATTSN